jgi:hypothetical protein
MGGSLISAALSNTYYPESQRGAGLVFTNFGTSMGLHRFFEVSIGIAVGLVLFALWQKIDLKFPVKVQQASLIG